MDTKEQELIKASLDMWKNKEDIGFDEEAQKGILINVLKLSYMARKSIDFHEEYPSKEDYVAKNYTAPEEPKTLSKDEELYVFLEGHEDMKILELEDKQERFKYWLIMGGFIALSALMAGVLTFVITVVILGALLYGRYYIVKTKLQKVRSVRDEKWNSALEEKRIKYQQELAKAPEKKKALEREYEEFADGYWDKDLAEEYLSEVTNLRILSSKYVEDARILAEYMEDGRADNLKEAINLLEAEKRQEALDQMTIEHQVRMESEARQQTRAMEAQTEYARRQAEATQAQAKSLAEVARAQERTAQSQERAEQRAKYQAENERGSSAQCKACVNRIGCQYTSNPPKNCGAFRSKYAK